MTPFWKRTSQACTVDVIFQNITGMILLLATKNPSRCVEMLASATSASRKWRPLDCTGRFALRGNVGIGANDVFFNPGLPVLEVIQGVCSIQPKFWPIWQGKVVHLKRWTSFFETFPVAPNWPIEFWTKISRHFGWMDRTQGSRVRPQKWITHGRL